MSERETIGMENLPELTEQERWLLGECRDGEEGLPQVILDLHSSYPDLPIGEKYRLAQELIESVVRKGVLEVAQIAYVEESPGYLVPVSARPVSLDELRRVWDHPMIWDRERMYDALDSLRLSQTPLERLVIKPTALGELALGELFEAEPQAEPLPAPDPDAPCVIDVVVDVSTLHRSSMGSVTAVIFLHGPTGSFPGDRWSDFPVVILGWWIEGLTQVLSGELSSFEGMFMDGPHAFAVERDDDAVRIALGDYEEQHWVGIVDLGALLRSATAAGRVVAEACHARGWESSDLEVLESAIARSAV